MARKTRLPLAIYTDDLVEIAGYLIDYAGGADAAHRLITLANEKRKKTRGAQPIDDTKWLVMAAAYCRQEGCTDNAALTWVASLVDEANTLKVIRRLRDKLDGKTLTEFEAENPLVKDIRVLLP